MQQPRPTEAKEIIKFKRKGNDTGDSLAAQCLGLCLFPLQGTWLPPLVREGRSYRMRGTAHPLNSQK